MIESYEETIEEKQFIEEYVKESAVTYQICRLLLLPLFWICYHPKVYGKENIPKRNATIIAFNHRSIFDPLFVGFFTPRTIHFLAKKELHEGFLGWFFRLAQTIPVDRSKHNKAVIDAGLTVLKKSQILSLAPEGTRNKTEKPLLPLKFGTVKMAQISQAYVVPVAIMSNYIPIIGKSRIIFGEPYKIDKNADLNIANQQLAEKMIALQEMIK